jgi:hypothetical protein
MTIRGVVAADNKRVPWNKNKTGLQKHSEETKRKMSKDRKGLVPWNKGKTGIYSRKTIEKISLSKKGKKRPDLSIAIRGSNNGNWKGNAIGYRTIRTWIKKYKPKPVNRLCEFCHQKPAYGLELANVTGVYKRGFSNWKYFCTKCRVRFYRNMLDIEEEQQSRCCKCGKNKALIGLRGYTRRFVVDKEKGLYQCYNCYKQQYRKKIIFV